MILALYALNVTCKVAENAHSTYEFIALVTGISKARFTPLRVRSQSPYVEAPYFVKFYVKILEI